MLLFPLPCVVTYCVSRSVCAVPLTAITATVQHMSTTHAVITVTVLYITTTGARSHL